MAEIDGAYIGGDIDLVTASTTSPPSTPILPRPRRTALARFQEPTHRSRDSKWGAFLAALAPAMTGVGNPRKSRSPGVRVDEIINLCNLFLNWRPRRVLPL